MPTRKSSPATAKQSSTTKASPAPAKTSSKGKNKTPSPALGVYRIKTGLSPTKGTPIQGDGSWIVNKHSGYYIGRVMTGGQFDVSYNSRSKKIWHYGRARGTTELCGWVLPESLAQKLNTKSDSCPAASRNGPIKHRRTFGKDFNAKASAKETGAPVKVLLRCKFYYNYFSGNFQGGHWQNLVGELLPDTEVLYRYTTLDGKAAVVKHSSYGWGFVRDATSVGRPPTVYNDND